MQSIIDLLAKAIVDLWPGLKVKLLGIVLLLTGIVSFISTSEFTSGICYTFGICNISSKVLATIISILGFLVIVARRATELYEKKTTDDESVI